jgi:NAD-dependent SIR2 family protein deacetylase
MNPVDKAAEAIRNCDAILICAGAGMGVDSGLPDFRGNEGFWKAYPPFAKLNLSFYDLADPKWFRDDPHQAWGFYGHRFNLYRDTKPHIGFEILRHWSGQKSFGSFVFTSNVDGHFQQSGFDAEKIVECHGSFAGLQCSGPCTEQIWPADGLSVVVDEDSMRAMDPLPRCPQCGGISRPNILMFGDWKWVGDRTEDQQARLATWLSSIPNGALTVVEIGAGSAVPTVRHFSERLIERKNAKLIRFNPRESHGPNGTISLAEGGLAALQAIDTKLATM